MRPLLAGLPEEILNEAVAGRDANQHTIRMVQAIVLVAVLPLGAYGLDAMVFIVVIEVIWNVNGLCCLCCLLLFSN